MPYARQLPEVSLADDKAKASHGNPTSRRVRRFCCILLAVCSFACLLLALTVLVVLLFVNPQNSRRAYVFRYYTLPRFLGAWARPGMPARYSGVWRDWHEDGRRYLEESFVGGVRHGKHTMFGAFDRKEEEGEYREGARLGKWTWWDAGGQVVAEGEYINGREWEGTFKLKCPKDRFSNLIISYTRGKRNGPYYVQNLGDRLEEGRYRDDQLDGQQTLWWNYEAKIKVSQGSFRGGKRHGWWSWWTAKGRSIGRGEYREGKEWEGAFAEWDTDKLGLHPYRGNGGYRVRRFVGGRQVGSECFSDQATPH